MNEEIYNRITERIIELLKQGVVPWQKPWDARVSMPRNLLTMKEYRGVNVLLLLSLAYQSPYWLTFRQVMQLGGHVKKGEKASMVVFWKKYTFEEKATGMEMNVPFLRYYNVFNSSQCDGLAVEPKMPVPQNNEAPLMAAQDIVANMPLCPTIHYGRVRACYSPTEDQVFMPSMNQFGKVADYYSALFHELMHSTGHESRLKRKTVMDGGVFGSDSYSKEELLAEIGSSFLCGQVGILDRTINNSAAYLNSWLKKFQDDTKLIVHAAAQAQRGVDFILNVSNQAEESAQSKGTEDAPAPAQDPVVAA